MKKTILLLVLSLFAAPYAVAAEADQQTKMKECNAEAKDKGLKGDERKAFMKTCLSVAKEEKKEDKRSAQQEKMKKCNADASAKNLKGDERKKFMKECLSG
jgi:hypothetical protein